MSSFPPGIWMVVGGLLLGLLPRYIRRFATMGLGLLAMGHMATLEVGTQITWTFWGLDVTVLDVDRLSLVFGWIFSIAIFLWSIYAFHLKSRLESVSALIYGGGALGVVFAGDMLTLFLYWELMAVASTGVVLAGTKPGARAAAIRYATVHFAGGVLLLFGIALRATGADGTLVFGPMALDSVATWLIFLGFAVNAAIPPLGGWMPDTYPEGSPSGSVFLSAFTTKTAVYVLATAFAGESLLIALGAGMSIYGIFYALNENDSRRILSYSIMNQVGFMVCGIGIGTKLAINGVAAHAFCHILYKSLLFMSAGAVYYRTGRTKCTELGGLWRTMPLSLLFGLVGALSISAMPLTNGFISKPMVVQAAANGSHGSALYMFAYIALLVASAGVSLHAGIKFPWFVFFGKDKGLRPKEAPVHMLIAMGVVSALCIGLGVYPAPLYALLPYEVNFTAYTADHVVLQLELLVASGFAFFLLLKMLKRTDTIALDTDWFYRRGSKVFYRFVAGPLMALFGWMSSLVHERIPAALRYFARNPAGAVKLAVDRFLLAGAGAFGSMQRIDRAQTRLREDQARYLEDRRNSEWPIGVSVLYTAVVFLIFLVIYLVR